MPDSGNKAAFTFAGTSYTTANCLQSWDFNNSINDIVYQCNSYDKHVVGTQSVMFRVTLALSATDTTPVIALAPGTTGAWEGHPGGDTATYIELTSTRGQVNSANISAPINGIIAMDVEIALDDVTLTTAA
jgi:hypothetical protein